MIEPVNVLAQKQAALITGRYLCHILDYGWGVVIQSGGMPDLQEVWVCGDQGSQMESFRDFHMAAALYEALRHVSNHLVRKRIRTAPEKGFELDDPEKWKPTHRRDDELTRIGEVALAIRKAHGAVAVMTPWSRLEPPVKPNEVLGTWRALVAFVPGSFVLHDTLGTRCDGPLEALEALASKIASREQ